MIKQRRKTATKTSPQLDSQKVNSTPHNISTKTLQLVAQGDWSLEEPLADLVLLLSSSKTNMPPVRVYITSHSTKRALLLSSQINCAKVNVLRKSSLLMLFRSRMNEAYLFRAAFSIFFTDEFDSIMECLESELDF